VLRGTVIALVMFLGFFSLSIISKFETPGCVVLRYFAFFLIRAPQVTGCFRHAAISTNKSDTPLDGGEGMDHRVILVVLVSENHEPSQGLSFPFEELRSTRGLLRSWNTNRCAPSLLCFVLKRSRPTRIHVVFVPSRVGHGFFLTPCP
jgi:hypothetical protein